MADLDDQDYSKMTPEAQTRFASEHFDRLSPDQQVRVALDDFNKGGHLNGQEAGIVDRTLGNGDGVFDQKDLQKIADDRNDKAFNEALAKGVTVMAEVAAASVLTSPPNFTFGVGDSLGGMFNDFASGLVSPTSTPLNTLTSQGASPLQSVASFAQHNI